MNQFCSFLPEVYLDGGGQLEAKGGMVKIN